jgi:hypothetical protein
LKPRVASFNGTLGFYTLGLLVEVLGEFELQRSMAWTWDAAYRAWASQVGGSVTRALYLWSASGVGLCSQHDALLGVDGSSSSSMCWMHVKA